MSAHRWRPKTDVPHALRYTPYARWLRLLDKRLDRQLTRLQGGA